MGEARRVFISHTAELRLASDHGPSFVDAAEDAIKIRGYSPIEMRYFTATPVPPASLCQSLISQADIYVAVLGFRWGSAVPDRPEISYTEFEYAAAKDVGIPRLIFLLDDELGATSVGGEHRDPRQDAFRALVKRCNDETICLVSSPQELTTKLVQSLYELVLQRQFMVTVVGDHVGGSGWRGLGVGVGGARSTSGARSAHRSQG